MRRVLISLACALPMSLGCGANYEVVKQAPQSPITPASPVVVKDPVTSTVTVDGRPQSELTSHLSPGEQQRWGSLMEIARNGILQGLTTNHGALKLERSGSGPTVEVDLTSVDLARQDPRAKPKTKLEATLLVKSPTGDVKDEVKLSSIVEAQAVSEEEIGATRERRFRQAALDLGRQAAEYLRARAGAD